MQAGKIYMILFGLFISGIASYVIFPNKYTKYLFLGTGALALLYCAFRKVKETYLKIYKEPLLIKGVRKAKCDLNDKDCGTKTFPSDKLLVSDTEYEYSISFWFRVDGWDFRYGADKVILNNSYYSKNSETSNNSPRIYLDKYHPILKIEQRVNKPNIDMEKITTENESYEKITVGNVPIQKWTHFFMTVKNKRVTVFINGKVVKGHVLKNMPKLNPLDKKENGKMILFGDKPTDRDSGFDGVIYSLKYYNRAADYDDISWEYNMNKPSE